MARLIGENLRLSKGLAELVKLQAHYATLLNGYDGGKRMTFESADAWLARLDELADPDKLKEEE